MPRRPALCCSGGRGQPAGGVTSELNLAGRAGAGQGSSGPSPGMFYLPARVSHGGEQEYTVCSGKEASGFSGAEKREGILPGERNREKCHPNCVSIQEKWFWVHLAHAWGPVAGTGEDTDGRLRGSCSGAVGGAEDGWEGEETPETTREGAEGQSRTTAGWLRIDGKASDKGWAAGHWSRSTTDSAWAVR